MIINTKFNIFETVVIRELNIKGMITEIKLSSSNIEEVCYCVEYWWESIIRTVWLHANQIRSIEDKC